MFLATIGLIHTPLPLDHDLNACVTGRGGYYPSRSDVSRAMQQGTSSIHLRSDVRSITPASAVSGPWYLVFVNVTSQSLRWSTTVCNVFLVLLPWLFLTFVERRRLCSIQE